MCMKIEEIVHRLAENFLALHNIFLATRTRGR